MRKFIRHPAAIPIDIAVDEQVAAPPVNQENISAGGLSFKLSKPVPVGAQLSISMPQIWPDYSATGTVVWCREDEEEEEEEDGNAYEAGVQFVKSNEAFKARMVAQFCQIEDYRRDINHSEGRRLSSEEAAREWIVEHAEEFAESIGWQ
jgi:hypothetical protein